jgi:hypothetical protein
MDTYDVRRLALIFAVQAEIEAMKAENQQRKYLDHAIAYTESDFENKAEQLRNLAYAHNEQL